MSFQSTLLLYISLSLSISTSLFTSTFLLHPLLISSHPSSPQLIIVVALEQYMDLLFCSTLPKIISVFPFHSNRPHVPTIIIPLPPRLPLTYVSLFTSNTIFICHLFQNHSTILLYYLNIDLLPLILVILHSLSYFQIF